MKRLFWAILAIYVLVFLSLMISLEPLTHQVKIVTIKEHLSMLIYPEEEISVLVYFNRMDTYYTSLELVNQASISCDSMTLPIDITSWESAGETSYKNEDFIVNVLSFQADAIDLTNMEMLWENVIINLTYENQETLKLEFGTWDIRFMDEEKPSVVDVSSLWMEERFSLDEATIHLELSSRIGSDIVIDSIQAWSTDIHSTAVEEFVFGPYEIKEFVIELQSSSDQTLHSRFPIVIEYELFGQTSYYWVDDYIFFREYTHSLEENPYEKHLITAQY